ncbi:MAG: ATP-dependent helicase HrpB [Pseudomonadota bacterium]
MSRAPLPKLPIDAALPDIVGAVASGRAILEAPPGAGKTTRVPPALLAAGAQGRILMLEPRRVAARAAALRMAAERGEPVGQSVGYRIRGDVQVSAATRIEVVTEGILTRMIQSDPSLEGVGTIIFDEFHERSLHADLGLALVLEVQEALRADLRILVMSATLDGTAVADLLDGAPVIRTEGRAFPVTTRWLDRPRPSGPIDAPLTELVETAVSETSGGVLVFLPGEGEIRRLAARLEGRLPADVAVRPLYGALPAHAQDAAIRPPESGRKVVLATSIAETSLTIEDVRVVVDGGLARRARHDPGSGMARLVTERVSRAEADQRRGRAGRVAAGICFRLWTKGEEGALPAYAPAEIETADLAALALDLALWGGGESLRFLTPPPSGALAEARTLLQALGALDAAGQITDHGRLLASEPVHPRIAHMLTTAGRDAAPLAALLSERDPLRGTADLETRFRLMQENDPRFDRMRAEVKRLAKGRVSQANYGIGALAAMAYPDRVALRRSGEDPRFLLSGGKGARLDRADPLAGCRLLAVTETDGHLQEAAIRQAARISEAELRALFPDEIGWHDVCVWSRRDHRVVRRQEERLGALVLAERRWNNAPLDMVARAMADGVRDLGLRLAQPAERFRRRVALARAEQPDLPEFSESALLATLETWLIPHLAGVETASDWAAFDALPALRAMLTWEQSQALDRIVPAEWTTPLGRRVPIDYGTDVPAVSVRLQEVFGVTRHPEVAERPLRMTLLSPAGRPVQVTTDLPGFWDTSYKDVRKDMRGRYPKHPWPEDPRTEPPTTRTKPRR